MERGRETSDPLTQLQALSEEVKSDWAAVVEDLKVATFAELEVDELTRERLESNFWLAHVELMEREEMWSPGITARILARSEQISQERRAAEKERFEKEIYPKLKHRQFWRRLIGMPYAASEDYKKLTSK